MKFRNIIKIVALVLVCIYFFDFVLPSQEYAYMQNLKRIHENGNKFNYEEVVDSSVIGNFKGTLLESLDKISNAAGSGDLGVLENEIQVAKRDLALVKEDLYKEISDNARVVDSSKVQEKSSDLVALLEDNFSVIEEEYRGLEESVNSLSVLDSDSIVGINEKISVLSGLVDPELPVQSLGELPNQVADSSQLVPAIGSGIVPAYGMGSSMVGESSVLSVAPVAGDLAETIETRLSGEMKTVVDDLKNPVEVYEFVKNNFDYESYYGSKKGAIGTFSQKSGNDYDQASLLIGLFRYKGIPARYVSGVIEVSSEMAMDWTGTESGEAAFNVLKMMGVPCNALTDGGAVSGVLMEHTWVEAYVPYDNYRGIGDVSGDSIWVPLDPSFKGYDLVEGESYAEILGIKDEEIQSILEASTDLNSVFSSYEGDLSAYFGKVDLENMSVREILSGRSIKEEKLGLLPLSLPYKVKSVLSERNDTSVEFSETVGFSIKGAAPFNLSFGGSEDFSVFFKSVELYGKRVSLAYVPASIEDEEIIEAFGGLFSTPSYLVELKPQLLVDGVVVAEGNVVNAGYRQDFSMSFGHVGQSVQRVSNVVTVGGLYSVALKFGSVDGVELEGIKSRLEGLQGSVSEDNVYSEEVLGEVLNSIGKLYFGQLDVFDYAVEKSLGVRSLSFVSEAMVGYAPKVSYSFGVPMSCSSGGFFIDVDHNLVGVGDVDGDVSSLNCVSYMMSSGSIDSAMEHGVMEEVFQLPGVSTMKVLSEAKSRGIEILRIDGSNASLIDSLRVSNSVKVDLRNAVSVGKVVIIPEEEIGYYDWYGTGYIVMDPDSGAAGYMISGNLAGGVLPVEFTLSVTTILMVIKAVVEIILIVLAMFTGGIFSVIVGVILIAVIVGYTYSFVKRSIEGIGSGSEELMWGMQNEAFWNAIIELAFMGVGHFIGKVVAPGALRAYTIARYGGYSDDIARGFQYGVKSGSLSRLLDYGFGSGFVERFGIYGDDGARRLLGVLDGYGGDVARLVNKYGDDAYRYFVKYGVGGIDDIGRFGDEVVGVFGKYGDDGVRALGNGISVDLINRLADYGIVPSQYGRYNIVSGDVAEKVAEAIANAKFTRTLLQSMRGFMDDVAVIVEKNGLTMDRFNSLRSKSASLLTSSEKASMKAIRDSVPMLTEDTIIQKVIPKADVQNYIDCVYSPQVKGYVTRAQDAKQLTNYEDIYNSLRLDYTGTAFNKMTDDSMGVIRFKSASASNGKVPYSAEMGGTVADGAPFTGNGFTAATNGQAIPEFKFDDFVKFKDGAELYEITKDGKEILRAVYNSNLGKFISITQ